MFNYAKCGANNYFLHLYGATQDPETKECIIVMRYANNGWIQLAGISYTLIQMIQFTILTLSAAYDLVTHTL